MENWREIIEMVAQGQRAMTQIEAVKRVVDEKPIKYDSDRINAVRAILGIEVEKDD